MYVPKKIQLKKILGEVVVELTVQTKKNIKNAINLFLYQKKLFYVKSLYSGLFRPKNTINLFTKKNTIKTTVLDEIAVELTIQKFS